MSNNSRLNRHILHLDLDAFYCAVEEQRDPTLRGQPFAVGGRPNERGVVASCSYGARSFGVRSAMPMSQAVKLCPNLIIVPPHFQAYRETSQRVMAQLRRLTPLVEQISIDEAYLDVTALPDPLDLLAYRLQRDINTQLHLSCSIGAGSNKLVAKIASSLGKDRAREGIRNAELFNKSPNDSPNAILIVPLGSEADFLAPLSVRELWGVGPKTGEQLAQMGIKTIGDLALWSERDLSRRFGKHGTEMASRARGIDDRPVETERETKSISKETTFVRDVSDRETLRRELQDLSLGVGREVRQNGLQGSTIKLKLRWSDFTTLTRQITLSVPTDQDATIYGNALHIFDKVWPVGKSVRLLGVGVSGFAGPERQLSLWDQPENNATPPPNTKTSGPNGRPNNKANLQNALDKLHEKFGDQSVQPGSNLKPKAE